MKKLMLIAALFALVTGVVFAQANQTTVAVGTDLSGSDDGAADGAILYARFEVCGVAFDIVSDDLWEVGDVTCIMPSEVVVQSLANSFTIENTGGVAIDLGFEITDQDDAGGPWTMTGAVIGTPPAAIDQYTLALVVGDNSGAGATAASFGNEDILTVDETGGAVADFYLDAAGQFVPVAPATPYAHAGADLNLWAGPNPTDDQVWVYLYFQMGSAGSSDAAPHRVVLGVGGKITGT